MSIIASKFISWRPRIAQFFGLLGFLSGATMFAFENAFISYSDIPDPASGRTEVYIVKYDLVRYVTPREALIGHATHYVMFASGIIFATLVILEMKKRGVWFKSDR